MSTDQQALDAYRRRIEAAAIAGLILQPAAIDTVREWLEPTDFSTPHYGDWYTHLRNLHGRGEPIDQMTLLTALRRADQLGPQGQYADELATITLAAPVPASTVEYCRSVLEEAIRDQVAGVGIRLTQLARISNSDAAETLTQAVTLTQQELHRVAQRYSRAELHHEGATVPPM
jgi:replicative DNA helicase